MPAGHEVGEEIEHAGHSNMRIALLQDNSVRCRRLKKRVRPQGTFPCRGALRWLYGCASVLIRALRADFLFCLVV
jgi:hypothetical protein